jgi:hypothetical protein
MLAVFAENRPGQLARVTRVLAEAGINIHWLGIAGVEIFGVIRFLVDDCPQAYERLKAAGFTVSLVDILAVEVPDTPGSLHALAAAMAENGLSLHNCSGFVFNNRAILLLELAELDKARRILGQRGLRLLTQAEMLNL